jgi:hypothetical protein
MTILIATLTRHAAWLSQDTLAVAPNEGAARAAKDFAVTADGEAAARSTFTGDGVPPEFEPSEFNCKISLLPHLGMLAGVAGSYGAALVWNAVLARRLPIADIAELPGWAQSALPTIMAAVPDAAQLVTVCLGLSRRNGRMMGFVFSSSQGFEPVELEGGHTMMPTPEPSCCGYDEIVGRWATAAQGVHVEEFHRLVAMNAHDSFTRGLWPKGTAMGGQLVTVRLDEQGITVGAPVDFPGRAELWERIQQQRFEEFRRSIVGTDGKPLFDWCGNPNDPPPGRPQSPLN